MTYPQAYIAYLVELHGTRDFFECHELLEEYWKQHPEDCRAELWIGLIQLAVGQYHERRGNRRGAGKMYDGAYRRLSQADPGVIGLDRERTLEQLAFRREQAVVGGAYSDLNLKLADPALERRCIAECRTRGLDWGAPSPDDDQIVHRHRLRDRSEVDEARAEAIRKKRQR